MEQSVFNKVLARAVALPAVFMILIAGVLLWQINRLLTAARSVERADRVIAKSHEAEKMMIDMETGTRGYLVTGVPVFLEPYQKSRPLVGPALDELRTLAADSPAQAERFAEISRINAEWLRYARDVIALREQNGDYQTPVRGLVGKRLMDAARARFDEVSKTEEATRDARAAQTRRAVWIAVGSVIALTVLLGSALGVFIRHQLLTLSRVYGRTLSTTQAQSEALRESGRKTATILESIGDAFLALDGNQRLTYVNSQAEQLLRKDREVLLGKTLWGEMPALADTAFARELLRAAAAKTATKFEAALPPLDNLFEVSVYPSSEGLSVYLTDVTGRRRAEQERARLREELIGVQAARLEELSTPLIPLSREVVIMPLIGTIDAERAAQVLDALSRGVASRGARVAVVDITGVSTVDTQVASALIRAAQVVHLLGAEVVLTGIRPRVAQTLITLGVELKGLTTRSTLQDGIGYATERLRKDEG